MPDGGFAKFWDASKAAYNWEGHARELAWKLSNKADSKADPKAPNPAATKGEVGDTEAAKVAAAAGVNMDAINDAIASGEAIPAEDRAKLNAVGIPDEAIDDFVDTKRGQIAAHVNEVTTFLGGKSGMAQLADWATKNFKPDEVQAFNEQLNDPARWRATAAYLLHQAGLPQGNRGTIYQGPNAGAPATSVSGYANDAELQSDIRKPLYKTDPAFREQVKARLRQSPHLMGQSSQRGITGGL